MYHMKKAYIFLLTLVMLVGATPIHLWAAPAAPTIHSLTQADGETFQARQWGDENLHGWETIDGYTMIFDEVLKSWTYAVPAAGGELMSSGITVKQGVPPPSSLTEAKRHLRPSIQIEENNLTPSPGFSPKRRTAREISALIPPPTGTANIPVILVNFNNTSTTNNTNNFNDLLFGIGNHSMKEFYQEVSYGAFSVSAGPGGVVGWYNASNTHDYYGQNVNGSDAWPGDLVYEAVRAADTAGFDFSPYDRDGDCYVDVVMIVHQGTGEEAGGPATDIWSHRWNLSSASYYGRSHSGEYTTQTNCAIAGQKIKVNDYVIQPEVLWGGLQTMGVFAHEYGHSLGLPDLYDTDYTSEGVGNWSLMAGGSWNGVTQSGDRPAHPDPWCKYKLGWVTPTKVNGRLPDEQITAANSTADIYQMLNGGPTAGGEYFLVENRQKAGFDAGLPGSGLLIWHVDEAKTTNNQECYPGGPPCSAQHYHVALVQADNLWNLEKGDNRGDAGDSYPGTGNKTAFSGSTSPNNNLYNDTSSQVSVTSISSSAATMTATLSTSGAGGYILTINKAGTGSGRVTSSPEGIDCSAACSAEYASGTVVTLTATPDANSKFARWSGACKGTKTCQVTMSKAQTVTAVFSNQNKP